MNARRWRPLPDMRLNRNASLERSQVAPAIKVAGIPVHSYVETVGDGSTALRFIVAVRCDGEPDPSLLDADGNVRLRITVNGEEVFVS